MGIIQRLSSKNKKEYFCGVGKGLVGISANGDIFPCHRFVGEKKLKLGNLNNQLLKDSDSMFKNSGIHSEQCSSCWARYFCGGGCVYDNINHDDFSLAQNQHWCNLMKKNIELGIYVYSSVKKHSLDRILRQAKVKYDSAYL